MKLNYLAGLSALLSLAACAAGSGPNPAAHQEAQQPEAPKLDARQLEAQELARLPPVAPKGAGLDHSGRKQTGRASYYADHFAKRKTADGSLLNPNADTAASKSLPLGTMAKVTNVQNGKSATVRIGDRGPFVSGRVVDVTPAVADQLDMRKKGVVPVIVAPITVPQPNGAVKLGAGAVEVSPEEVAQATQDAVAAKR